MTSPASPTARPYELSAEGIVEPPVGTWRTLRQIGPGLVLSASVVGSGELIATTTLGAQVGYVLLWLVIASCMVKAGVQVVLGRHTILTGETTLAAFARVPGPRPLMHWLAWLWIAVSFTIVFALGAMYIGVAQVVHALVPAIGVTAWVLLLFGLTLALVIGGGYQRIERIALVKVSLFVVLTLLAVLLLFSHPQYFDLGRLADGLTFQVPEAGLSVAIAVFGITGVAAGELCTYPYWCIEKGYARFAGPRDDSPEWRARADGWLRVMYLDVMVSTALCTVVTIAFYLLGAGVLHGRGDVPAGTGMIASLSAMYTTTLGPWAVWVFYAGAIVTLYGTIFAVTAGSARVLADVLVQARVYHRDDHARRARYRDLFTAALNALAVGCFLVLGQIPVTLVTWTGTAQALLLPVVAIAALFLVGRRGVAAPRRIVAIGWIATIVIVAFVALMLYLELARR
ncbi:MAG TPA: Nramp family divalent metal transporter [Kofleriaceae bacterium]|nr:Nramp family divalent metal transporter [Kofleriaceae bacterium]